MTTGYGRLKVSPELLKQALHLPDDLEILNIYMAEFHTIEMVVSAEGLPECTIGDRPKEVMATITHKPEEFIFEWAIPHDV